MVYFGLLAADIDVVVWGSAANVNGFRVLASLLQRRRSPDQTLHDVWPSPGLLHYIYIFGGCCPVTEFCQVQNSVCVFQVLRSPIGSVTARHSSSGREPNFAALSTRRHLYSAGRPLRWALAHILIENDLRIDRSPKHRFLLAVLMCTLTGVTAVCKKCNRCVFQYISVYR